MELSTGAAVEAGTTPVGTNLPGSYGVTARSAQRWTLLPLARPAPE
ncbi:MAG: hypothetical protein WKH64_11245 [Chloroflexia bacterium]